MEKLKELKARAYDLIANIDQSRAILSQVNEQIALEYKKVYEESGNTDHAPANESKKE